MRNGLNGRGSSWSVVRDDSGQWWKIHDLASEKVSRPSTAGGTQKLIHSSKIGLEDALNDATGLHMNAGATYLFYQNASVEIKPAVVPSLLKVSCLNQSEGVENGTC